MKRALSVGVLSVSILSLTFATPSEAEAREAEPKVRAGVVSKIKERGIARAMIVLDIPQQSSRNLGEAERRAQAQSLVEAKKALIAELSRTKFTIIKDYVFLPMLQAEIDADAASILNQSSRVLSVGDEIYRRYQLF